MATDQSRAWTNSRGADRPRGWFPPRLTPQQRDQIRQRLLDGEDPHALALEYKVTARTIRSYAD
jgi:hypothetical protein